MNVACGSRLSRIGTARDTGKNGIHSIEVTVDETLWSQTHE